MISADEIRSRLVVDKSRLDDEWELHSQIAEQISRRVAQLEREAAEAHDDLKRCEAGLVLDFKREEVKQTASEVEARVVRDNRRREALKVDLAFAEQLAAWKGLQAAWRDKGFAMRGLADLYLGSYYDSSSTYVQRRERENDRSYRDALPRKRRTFQGGD